jgi:hypothetical protein
VNSRSPDDVLASPLGLQLLDYLAGADLESLTEVDLSRLLLQAVQEASIYGADYDAHVASLRSRASKVESLAGWLRRRMPQWWHDMDRARQVWVGSTPEPPDELRLMIDLDPIHAEASKPKRAFWTSTADPAVVSPWLEWPERMFSGPSHLWRVAVSAAARVAEVHTPAQWSAFARTYAGAHQAFRWSGRPQSTPGSARIDPDWSKVAGDWDGVHLSVGGLLTAQDVPYESNGATTELRGWDMESTVWFRWSFDSVGRL